ncbi:MAG: bacteriocin [Rhizobiales bacterium]|nr:bacteriocin [Hyphomicrobiales bacterium]
MRKVLIMAAAAATLAGCQTAREDRAVSGALIGGGTGAIIGGVASNSVGGALAGGVIGAAAGAIIADATRPGRCYVRTRSGRLRRVACR